MHHRLIPYPPELLQLIPPNLHGAIFLPSVGRSSLAASLSGGDYDGDLFLLLWEPRVLASFRHTDPPPSIASSSSNSSGLIHTAAVGSSGSSVNSTAAPSSSGSNKGARSAAACWAIAEGAGWEFVERQLSAFYSYSAKMQGLMGEAHNLWEFWADRYGAGHDYCTYLADM